MLGRRVKYFVIGVNMSDNYYRQLDHRHGPPRTARTNSRGRATTCNTACAIYYVSKSLPDHVQLYDH